MNAPALQAPIFMNDDDNLTAVGTESRDLSALSDEALDEICADLRAKRKEQYSIDTCRNTYRQGVEAGMESVRRRAVSLLEQYIAERQHLETEIAVENVQLKESIEAELRKAFKAGWSAGYHYPFGAPKVTAPEQMILENAYCAYTEGENK